MDLPKIVSREEWLVSRKKLLKKEKEFTRQRDELNAERRSLPMVKIEKEYSFEGPDGKAGLTDLFENRRQLIVYHFMFDPDWEEGCASCSFVVDNIGNLSHLLARNTTLALVSRAPLAKIEKYKTRMGWNLPWYSSYEDDFNHDFKVTMGKIKDKGEYNYRDATGLVKNLNGRMMELPGISVFIQDVGSVFHTYSSYARGLDILLGTYHYLDLTPLGRQEDWEEPSGRSSDKSMSWLRRHDQYDS
ncbi:MAG: DUF899 domain-containing protein [Balneolaceae bacterium]